MLQMTETRQMPNMNPFGYSHVHHDPPKAEKISTMCQGRRLNGFMHWCSWGCIVEITSPFRGIRDFRRTDRVHKTPLNQYSVRLKRQIATAYLRHCFLIAKSVENNWKFVVRAVTDFNRRTKRTRYGRLLAVRRDLAERYKSGDLRLSACKSALRKMEPEYQAAIQRMKVFASRFMKRRMPNPISELSGLGWARRMVANPVAFGLTVPRSSICNKERTSKRRWS